MPFKSVAQNAWAHTTAGTKALGGPEKVKEWEQSTNYDKLPEHVSKPEPETKVAPKKAQRMRRTSRAR